MLRDPSVGLFDLVGCLSGAMDLISPAVVNHHRQVAYVALSIGAELSLPARQLDELVLAGALHDIGALSLQERISSLQFETEDPHRHAELGYRLTRTFAPFARVAPLIRFHHVPWQDGAGVERGGEEVPPGSHVLHLADRVAILVERQQEVLGQVARICETLREQAGKMFRPELVDAFLGVAAREFFWFDLVSPSIGLILSRRVRLAAHDLDTEGLLGLARLFARIIDFKSAFTATHSSGVAAAAASLAGFTGFSERECRLMRIAGYLHDLGKLAVPLEILEKPSRLSPEEFNIMRSHAFHTYRALEAVADLDVINTWASFHHERLDGTGYPFHISGRDLPLGAQVMAVADVFTAIREDRPYRQGMGRDAALQVLERMAGDAALNAGLVSMLRLHYDEVDSVRLAAQAEEAREYQELRLSP